MCAVGGLRLLTAGDLLQLWAFIAPGLYPSEKKVALPFVVCSTLLFIGGGTFGYYVVFPLVFEFFAGFSSDFVQSA